MELIPIRVFYSYYGYQNGVNIVHGHGVTDKLENIDDFIMEIEKKSRPEIDNIHIIAITPLDFKSIQNDKSKNKHK